MGCAALNAQPTARNADAEHAGERMRFRTASPPLPNAGLAGSLTWVRLQRDLSPVKACVGRETRRESLRKHRARFEPTTFGFGEPLPSAAPSAIAWIVQRVTPKENGRQRGRRDCFGRDSPPPAFTLARALARHDDTHAHGLGSIHPASPNVRCLRLSGDSAVCQLYFSM